ncbi:hypothetical protein JOB18_006762 [Solea senegalensis]|uniref:Uncharacterized protein n=1 Tax=Solea senegalensis TaxID=28829 RepID=A0AAV6PPT1_SOLSE|nr:uncharacterized protein LOC122775155 [Solea senegalensis]KAG7474345.1 hypothetical protein JOB18_006762 [Solea senegalensis]
MAQTKMGARNPLTEAAVGFALGTVAGCILGATEDPLDKTLSMMTEAGSLRPVIEEIEKVGPLGLGTLIGASALTTATTSAVAGVILAAVAASMFVATRSCTASHSNSGGLWASAGLAGAFGTTLSGATLGLAVEWIVMKYGMMGLLWALSIFTLSKPPLHFVLKLLWKQSEACCTLGSTDWVREREQIESTESQQRQRVAVQIEQKILTLENGSDTSGNEDRTTWDTERRQREEIERKKVKAAEAEMEQRTLQEWINTVVVKHVDFLAFSGIPMTIVAIVTSGFGIFGYGGHQSVFIVLLALVIVMAYFLIKSSDFKFWMLVGCMGMLATFVIAMLTLHAGQMVVTTAMKMHATGQKPSREDVRTRMNQGSSLEALKAAFFVAKLCQLALGAAVGGPLVRQAAGEVKVIAGAALVALGLLVGVEVLAPALGKGGQSGALLGVVGAAGVSVGAASAVAGRWSSWQGTLGTVAGLVIGALAMGKWHVVNIGLQVPVAYVFAMTNPF